MVLDPIGEWTRGARKLALRIAMYARLAIVSSLDEAVGGIPRDKCSQCR